VNWAPSAETVGVALKGPASRVKARSRLEPRKPGPVRARRRAKKAAPERKSRICGLIGQTTVVQVCGGRSGAPFTNRRDDPPAQAEGGTTWNTKLARGGALRAPAYRQRSLSFAAREARLVSLVNLVVKMNLARG
jgi:hypothetical protein